MTTEQKILKKQCYRHGEIAFCLIDKLPDNLEETKTDTIMRGSGNNPHTFKGGKLFLKNVDNFIFGYFEAKNTKLFHLEHGDKISNQFKEAILPNGIYELRKGREFINNELRPIID